MFCSVFCDSLLLSADSVSFQVWDLSKACKEPGHTVHTVAPVSRVRWRPGCMHHIASCQLLTDYCINVWDVRRPYMSFASFTGHKDIVTCQFCFTCALLMYLVLLMFLVNVGSHTCYSYFAATVFIAVGLCDWSQGTLWLSSVPIFWLVFSFILSIVGMFLAMLAIQSQVCSLTFFSPEHSYPNICVTSVCHFASTCKS